MLWSVPFYVCASYNRLFRHLACASAQVADIRWDIIGEIGTFYSDLLDRRGAVVFESIEKLPADRQKLVCKLAYEDDLSIDSPKPDRVITFLKRLGGEVATRCSSAFGGS